MTDKANDSGGAETSFFSAVKLWHRIGWLSFGGPSAQIALMHRLIVEERKWLSEERFLNALSFCMLLPGPEAMQLATYAGWRLHGVKGGLAAGLLFILPGAAIVFALSLIYLNFGQVPLVQTLFLGVKACVVVIVIEALFRISKRALKSTSHLLIAALAFVGIFFFALPFPLIILLALPLGLWAGQSESTLASPVEVHWRQSVKTLLFWLAVWLFPLVLITLLFGPNHILSALGWFFSKLAIVTFGGAYAVLTYMGQDVVQAHGWLEAGQMIDGLGLAETTPGPLILVTEFVGFLAASQAGGTWYLGIAGALVALWCTFVPCFLFIFLGAPYVEWINGQPHLKAAMTGVIAAVVGVILNLSLWFALHVLFGQVELIRKGPVHLWLPDLGSLNLLAVGLTIVSGWLLLRRHWNVALVLAICAGLSASAHFVSG